MVFPSGARQRGAEFAITKRAAQRHDSANDPKHEQRESRVNVCQLKAEAGEDARADNVGNNDEKCRKETNRPSRSSRLHRTRLSNRNHIWIDNPEILGASEFFQSGL